MTELTQLTSEGIRKLAADSRFVAGFEPNRSAEATSAAVASIDYWYQSMYLGHGILTGGQRDAFAMLRLLRLPESLLGKTVLDIGSAEGFFSFECEARGASRVIAVDHPGYRAFRPAHRVLRELFASSIELVDMDVEEGEFPEADVVLFLGVLYHLQDPLGALRRLRKATREAMYLETHSVDIPLPKLPPFGDAVPPIAVFYPGAELSGDRSNWWSPNLSCLQGMLEAAGFEHTEVLATLPPGDWSGRTVVRADVLPSGRARS